MRPRFLFCSVLMGALGTAACGSVPRSDGVSPTTGPSPHEDRPDVQIALIEATSGGSSLSALHAMQGARLALDLANEEGGLPVDVLAVASDTEEDSTRVDEIVDELSGDPRYVAAVIWPSTEEAAELGDRLSTAGIPFIDLSPAVPGLGRRGWDGWRRRPRDGGVPHDAGPAPWPHP